MTNDQDGDAAFGIKVGDIASDDEATPPGLGEKLLDLRVGSRSSGNGGLFDQEPQAGVRGEGTEKPNIITEEFVVQEPAFQVGDGRGHGLLAKAMDDKQAEEVRPSRLED